MVVFRRVRRVRKWRSRSWDGGEEPGENEGSSEAEKEREAEEIADEKEMRGYTKRVLDYPFLSISPSLHLSVSPCLCLSVYPSHHLYVCPSVHPPSLCLSISLSLCLSVCPSPRLYVCSSLCGYVYPSVRSPVHLFRSNQMFSYQDKGLTWTTVWPPRNDMTALPPL